MWESLEIPDIEETVPVGISQPGIGGRALHASVQEHFLFVGEDAWNLPSARVGQRAVWLSLHLAFSLPFLEVVYCCQLSWGFHPVDDLLHCDEEIVSAQGGIPHPLHKLSQEVTTSLEVTGCEVETKRRAVGPIVTGEVVVKEGAELFWGLKVGTLVHKVATSQFLVELWVVTTIQLIHHHLPHGEVLGGAILVVTQTLVGHTVHEGIRPEWQTSHRGRNGRIIQETPVNHHAELLVSTNSLLGNTNAQNLIGCNISEFFNDETSSIHFRLVFLSGKFAPVIGVVIVSDGADTDLVAHTVELLHGGVVGEGMGEEEGALGGTVVALLLGGILEYILEDAEVTFVDGACEGDGDHLGRLFDGQVPGDASSVDGAEAARRPDTRAWITHVSPVGIRVRNCRVRDKFKIR